MEHGANGRSTSSATTCESSPTRADRPRSRQHERRGAPSRAQLRTPRNQREAATTGQGSLSRLIELRSGTAFRFGPTHLVNMGDAKSLVAHPASTTHRQLSPEALAVVGVAPEAIRLSIGIEHVDDPGDDIDQALSAAL